MILTSLDKKIIHTLQDDFPVSFTPYADMAKDLAITEKELHQKIKDYQKAGILRRVGGIVRHQKLGYHSNAMVVWLVPDHQIAEIGRIMASHSSVSHCYQRHTMPDFPYNLYTMIHGKNPGDCEKVVQELSTTTGIKSYHMLNSLRELKKTSMKYFRD